MTRETDETAPAHADVLRELVDQHGPSVYRMARSIVRDPALAEDVAQETFIKAWQHADSYRGSAPVRHWLLRIAHNVAVSTLRTVKDDATDPAALPMPATPAVEATVEARRLVEDALARLDPLSRSIVVLRELEGFTYGEISDLLDIPLPTVKTRLFRARAVLKQIGEENS